MKTILIFFLFSFLSLSLLAQNVTFKVYNQGNTPVFTTNAFKQVAVGKGKNIWVGTANAGIYQFNGTSWVKGTVLLNNNIRTIIRGKDSCIVIGQAGYNAVQATTGGVDVFPGASMTNYSFWGSPTGGLTSRYINGCCVSPDGTVWTANGQDLTAGITKEGGVGYLTPGAANFSHLTDGLPASDIRIWTIASSSAEIWASIDRSCPTSSCTNAGILRYSTSGSYLGKFDASNTPIPFVTGNLIVRAMCFTAANNAWVGFNTNGGIAVYAGGSWAYLTNANNKKIPLGAAVNINAMRADKSGRVYIGTTMGLLVYTGGSLTDTASFQLYTTANGLPSNNITGIEPYDYKTTWITTGAGIVKMEESFKPNPNGWQFSNSKANIWPRSWYHQFNYANDPYLGGGAPFPQKNVGGVLTTIGDSSFPDWPLFVQTIGESQCYQTVAGVKVIKPLAAQKYFSIVGKWAGSCFGFVQSSFMVWDSIQRFKAAFPSVNNWTSNKLYDLTLNDNNRKCINMLMTKQSQQTYWSYLNPIWTNTPRVTLASARQMLQDNSRNDRGLLLYNQNGDGGHIVNPYKIVRDTVDPDLRFIYIYDNNYPGDTTRRVVVDSILDCWYYNLSVNANSAAYQWGGITANKGLLLCTPVRDWYNPVSINNVAKITIPSFMPDAGTIEIYNRDSSDILIKNAAGQEEGSQAGKLIENIPGAIPMLSLSSINEVPKGYSLPADNYEVKLSQIKHSNVSLTLFSSSNSFDYSRNGATIAQNDFILCASDGMLVKNHDNIAKSVSLSCDFEDAGNEMKVEILKLGQSFNGNSGLHIFSSTEVKLLNTGAATKYDLKLHFVGSNGESEFLHDSVPIAANTAHIIHPDWANLKTAVVMVFVDNGNNGSYEDTLYLGNGAAPKFLSFPTKLDKTAASSMDSIHVINIGGGILNWTVASSDTSWLTISGNTGGPDAGSVAVSLKSDTSAARNGTITLSQINGNQVYVIKVSQQGILAAPLNIQASDGTFSDGVHVSWSKTLNATHYKVYRAEDAGASGIALSSWIGDTTFVDSTCNKGQFYYYRIKAAQDSLGFHSTDLSLGDDGWARGFTANFSFNGECYGQATNFQEISTSHTQSTYSWDIYNDGTMDYTGPAIQFTFPAAGSYPVKLSITDDASNTVSIIKTIIIKAFPSISLPVDTTICANQTITLNAGSGFSSYLWSTGALTSSISLDSTGFGLGMSPVSVKVTAVNGCTALATTRVTRDTCSVLAAYVLSGLVTYDNTALTHLNNVSVILKQNGSVVHQTTTDSQGNYSFSNLQSGTYVLTGSSGKAWGGVNSVDALKTSRHFVGLSLLQGVRKLAADVNGSGGINSVDALLIAKRFVGLNTSFAAGDWAFPKDTIQFANTSNQTANFKAVVVGDVDGSYNPPAKTDYGLELLSKGILIANNSDAFEIPVSVAGACEIGAISLILTFPAQLFDLENVTTSMPGTFVYNVVGSELRIAWYSLEPVKLSAGDILLSLKGHAKTREAIAANSWVIDPESILADQSGEALRVKISIPEIISNTKECYLSQNVPNPFNAHSEISWYMPEAGRVVLKVYDLPGNAVKTLVDANFGSGTHTTSLDGTNLQAGTYYYRLILHDTGNGFSQTKKFILIK